MSLDAMLAVMKLPAGRTTTSERLLLLAMAESASEDGELSAYCRSQAFLAAKCGWLNPEAVRKVIRSLERKRLIECQAPGAGLAHSSYRLTFLESVPTGSLSKVFREHRNVAKQPPPNGGGSPLRMEGGSPLQMEGAYISVVPTSSPHERPSHARGLKKWFERELWPRFPEQVDKVNTWREIELLNPGEDLRAEILAGLDRAIAAQEREALDSIDGFVRALPSPRNWLRGRRWEDAP